LAPITTNLLPTVPLTFVTIHPFPPPHCHSLDDLKKLSYSPNTDTPIYNPISTTFTIIPQQSFQSIIKVIYHIDSSNSGQKVEVFCSDILSFEQNVEKEVNFELNMEKLRQYSEHILYNVAEIILSVEILNNDTNNTQIDTENKETTPNLVKISEYRSIVSVSKPDYGVDLICTIYSPF
jgi:hypothetical protein